MRRAAYRGLVLPGALASLIVLLAIAAPLLPITDPVRQDIAHRLTGPSAQHWLGQDEYGRDVLSRIIWGARVSLSVAFSAAAAAALIGTLLGILGGYFRGVVELLTVRAVESRDYPEVMGIVLVISAIFVLLNFLVDLLYAVIDPRVRHG